MRKELIRPHEAIDDTFRFRHMLIRDAAYDRIPKRCAPTSHERFAGWLDGRGEEFEEIIGYHLDKHVSRRARLRDRAHPGHHQRTAVNRWLVRQAGLRAGDLSAAADLLGRAERLPPPDRHAAPLSLLLMLGSALTDQGKWERARTCCSR